MTPATDDVSALRGAHVLLGVSGGIACYKAVDLARLLGKAGARVQVLMTEAATRFVGTVTFASLTRRPVYTSVFEEEDTVLHVRLAREADLVIVAPATANVIAKMAQGIADDLLTSVLLTATCPVLVAPAMHTEMWEHPATRANLATLRERGIAIADPEVGELAAGDEGVGRLAEPQSILRAAALVRAHGHDFAGVRVLVTAGGTREPIDPVRYIGNRSSGKMGFALAAEAARRGAEVTLVSGPTHLADPPRTDVVRVETVQQMLDAVLERYDRTDVVIKAAAVSDFRPAGPSASKIHKDAGPPQITLTSTADILATLGKDKGNRILVGFKAETEDAVARGRKMLAAKNLDLVVVNQVGVEGSGFEADTNRAILLSAEGEEVDLPLQAKSSLAREVLDRVARILAARGRRPL